LAARSDHRPARHCFAMVPSRQMGHLGIRLKWPLARRPAKDQQRGACTYRPDEPREFPMGRAADPRRAAEAWIQCLASHSVPLHATARLSAHPELAHLPAKPGTGDQQSWRSRSDTTPTSCSCPRVARADGSMRYQAGGSHLLQVYPTTADLAPLEDISLYQSS
jgi:hypothetical protein